MKRILLILVLLALLLAACQSVSIEMALEPNDEPQPMTELEYISKDEALDIVITRPVVLGQSGRIYLSNGEAIGIFLEMTSGRYGYDEADLWGREWAGEFRISVYAQNRRHNDNLLSTLPIATIGHNHFFPILVDDYTGDGNPDFTIAVNVLGSQGRYFRTFTIEPDFTIRELEFESNTENGLLVQYVSSDSIRFIHTDGQVVLHYFSNHYSELSVFYYSWNGNYFSRMQVIENLMAEASASEKIAFLREQGEQMQR